MEATEPSMATEIEESTQVTMARTRGYNSKRITLNSFNKDLT